MKTFIVRVSIEDEAIRRKNVRPNQIVGYLVDAAKTAMVIEFPSDDWRVTGKVEAQTK